MMEFIESYKNLKKRLLNNPNASYKMAMQQMVDVINHLVKIAPSTSYVNIKKDILLFLKNDFKKDIVRDVEFKKNYDKLIEETFNANLKIKNSEYNIPNVQSAFTLKKINGELRVVFDNHEYDLESGVYQLNDKKLTIEKTREGFSKLKVSDEYDKTLEAMAIVEDKNNHDRYMINTSKSNGLITMDLNNINYTRKRFLEQNMNFLENFSRIEDLQDIINKHAGFDVRSVDKLVSSDGKEYFVAKGLVKSAFYELRPNGFSKINSNRKEMEGLDMVSFELGNGKTFFVELEDGKSTYMEINKNKKSILNSQQLYDRNNKIIADVIKGSSDKDKQSSDSKTDDSMKGMNMHPVNSRVSEKQTRDIDIPLRSSQSPNTPVAKKTTHSVNEEEIISNQSQNDVKQTNSDDLDLMFDKLQKEEEIVRRKFELEELSEAFTDIAKDIHKMIFGESKTQDTNKESKNNQVFYGRGR